jgi:kinetochore protein Mis12/MTW1
MPPRKSVAKGKQTQTVASSSKVTLDSLPPPNIPESLTPDFQPNQRIKIPLDSKERQALVHEVRLSYGSHVSCDH